MQRPYFIEYRLDDITTYEAVANYGALTREEPNHQRVVRVTVRIGDYAIDSSSSRGDGTIELAPTDNDPLALQYALWTATDDAYKNALRAYSAKQAALKQFQSAQAQHDFAQAKPVVQVSPLVTLDLDRNEWKRRIIEASGLYASDPEAAFLRRARPVLHREHPRHRPQPLPRQHRRHNGPQGYTGYNGAISVGGQAADGMRLSRDNGTVATTAKELESASAFRKRVIDDLKSFEELRNAPVVSADDYHGPVLFSGDAASPTSSIASSSPTSKPDRPEMGTTARTTGAYSSSYKSRVLPDMLSVTDDPLQTKFNGKALLGAYSIDDEGVPAQSVDIVTHGKLENFLIGREPVKDFAASNGHGRAAPAQAPHSRAGVVLIKADQAVSKDELNKRLLAMAKEQGKDVYAVETLGGELLPRLLYRVHADGTRQLVRGAVFDELDSRSLRSGIVAAGNDPYVSNSLGVVPQTTIAPSMLFDDIGVKRATVEQQKLPYYVPPALPQK